VQVRIEQRRSLAERVVNFAIGDRWANQHGSILARH